MRSKKVLLLRHGETNWNREQRFQGSRDIQLNQNGEEQARLVSSRVRAWQPGIVFSSPLGRALTTARIATGLDDEKIHILPELTEINFGVWEGCSVSELRSQGPLFEQWARDPFRVSVPGAEEETAILQRAARLADRIKNCDEEKILLVSHGGTLRALLAFVLGFSLRTAWRNFRLSNCALTGLECSGEKFVLAFYNDHFSADMTLLQAQSYLPPAF